MTEIIRRAVRLLHDQMESTKPSTDELLENTRGLWKHGDGLAYQEKIRDEW